MCVPLVAANVSSRSKTTTSCHIRVDVIPLGEPGASCHAALPVSAFIPLSKDDVSCQSFCHRPFAGQDQCELPPAAVGVISLINVTMSCRSRCQRPFAGLVRVSRLRSGQPELGQRPRRWGAAPHAKASCRETSSHSPDPFAFSSSSIPPFALHHPQLCLEHTFSADPHGAWGSFITRPHRREHLQPSAWRRASPVTGIRRFFTVPAPLTPSVLITGISSRALPRLSAAPLLALIRKVRSGDGRARGSNPSIRKAAPETGEPGGLDPSLRKVRPGQKDQGSKPLIRRAAPEADEPRAQVHQS